MLFEVINCDFDGVVNNSQKMDSLSNLLLSHYERKNIVIADNVLLLKIQKSNVFGVQQRSAAADILSSRREILGAVKKLLIKGVVDFNSTVSDCSFDEVNKRILFGYNFFADSASSQSVFFVAENLNDCKFYHYLSKMTSGIHDVFNINLNYVSGGGSQSKDEFDRLVSNRKLTLCIVDSDKKHPKGGRGSTAEAFSACDFSVSNNGLAILIDKRREAENLIPPKIYYEVLTGSSKEKIRVMDEVVGFTADNNDFYKYFDFKEGLLLKDAIAIDSIYGKFWVEILGKSKKFSSHACYKNLECTGCAQCPSVEGVGGAVLAQVVNYLERNNLHKVRELIDQTMLDDLNAIFDAIASWGCAMKGRASRT